MFGAKALQVFSMTSSRPEGLALINRQSVKASDVLIQFNNEIEAPSRTLVQTSTRNVIIEKVHLRKNQGFCSSVDFLRPKFTFFYKKTQIISSRTATKT